MTTLAHTRTGTGEPVLLLHGISHRRQAWDRVLPLMSGERDLIAVDLPDHGDSPDLPPGTAGTSTHSPTPSRGSPSSWASSARTWSATRSAA